MLHQASVLLVKRNFLLHLIDLFLGKIVKIALIPQRSESGNRKPRPHRRTPKCLMIRTCGYMRADAFHRITVAVALLNLRTAHGVRIIGCPDLREIAKDSEIKTVAARRTSFKKNVREFLCKRIHDFV